MFKLKFLGAKNRRDLSLDFVAFLQGLGLVVYCGLVGLLMWKGESWFGSLKAPLGSVLFLLLFIFSAIICALIALGYSFLIFWEGKNTKKAIRLVAYTTLWLFLFILLFILILLTF